MIEKVIEEFEEVISSGCGWLADDDDNGIRREQKTKFSMTQHFVTRMNRFSLTSSVSVFKDSS